MADENEVLENEAVAGTETTTSTPEITGDFSYNYSKIDSISGVSIPDKTENCKSLLELAAMAYNMSNKQTAYNQAAFAVISAIIEKYNGRISKNEDQLSTHENEITELQQLVGNLNLESTTSLMEATQQLVKILFNDDNYKDGINAGSGNGIINDLENRIGTLEADKVTYNYSGTDDTKTHKIAITHPSSDNEDVDNNKTDIYTAAAVDAVIDYKIKTKIEENSSSVGSGSTTTGDKYIKGQVETKGITFTSTPITSNNPNFLMSEEAIVQTLNSLIKVLEDRETTLKEMAEDFGKFLATFQLEDAVVYNGALYCSRKIGNSDFWQAVAPSGGSITFGSEITLGGPTEIATKKYTLVKYTSTYTTFEVSAYIPNGTDSMANVTATGKLVPLGVFFGGNITWEELTVDDGPWKSENVVYYVTDKEESYITNGKNPPAIFAKGKKGDQGPQGISIKSIEGSPSNDSGATNTYTIVLKDPATNEENKSNTFSVTNGYGFRYIGTLTTEHESELPALGENYTTSITSGWDLAPEGKSVQINDYIIITDSTGNKIKVFNGAKWQEMIKGAVGPQGAAGTSIVPIYFDVAEQANLIPVGNLKSSSDYTTAIETSLKNKYKNDYTFEAKVYSTNNTLVIKGVNCDEIVDSTLPEGATAIIVKAVESGEPTT